MPSLLSWRVVLKELPIDMRQYGVFIKKEFKHIIRDKRSLLILFALPIAQILIFGFALTNEIKNTKIAILDLSQDEASHQLRDQLIASQYFELNGDVHDVADVESALLSDQIKLAVIIPENFQNDLSHGNEAQVQLIADATDPNTATTLSVYASAVIRDFQGDINGAYNLPYTITPEVRMLYNPQLKGAYLFVPGVMGMILLLISAMMTSIAIVREKEINTMEIILASPLKPIVLILSKAVPYITISLVNVTTILLISIFILGLPVAGNIFLLFAVCFLFITTAIALGLMISNITDSQQTAMFISLMGLMLPTLILSGFMFPIENMPVPMQVLSNIVPTKWFFIIVKDVMIKGLGFASIWREVLILTGMTLFFLFVSYKKFKTRLA
ncbi:MAG TPA: ABC transporter permease [Chitinophagales bacterium]|nr:ABC transporter permease [Chitinophagales bacterium]